MKNMLTDFRKTVETDLNPPMRVTSQPSRPSGPADKPIVAQVK